jgi:hypothetical protein
MMEAADWEPLPPRRSKRKNNFGLNFVTDECKTRTPHHVTNADRAMAAITANIAARAQINRSQTTLESHDGCAGEYYECE